MKSDSAQSSQILTVDEGKVMDRQDVNCPSESSNLGGRSPVKSENSNLVALANLSANEPALEDEPMDQTIRTSLSDTLSKTPATQAPSSNWPPTLNEALTTEERLAQWDRWATASGSEMTPYDLDVITFGRKTADHLREVFG